MPGPALLLVDFQKAFLDPRMGPRNNPEAEANACRLLASWRSASLPLFHVRYVGREPKSLFFKGKPGVAFMEGFEPRDGEDVVERAVNSAFLETDLQARLERAGVRDLVVCGLTTDHCVSTTVRMASNLGFNVTLVADATATMDRRGPDGRVFPAQSVHDVEVASLMGEFATIALTAEIAAAVAGAPARQNVR